MQVQVIAHPTSVLLGGISDGIGIIPKEKDAKKAALIH
jgi:hypothetical protein